MFSTSIVCPSALANSPICEIVSSSSGVGFYTAILEIGLVLADATACSVGLTPANAQGTSNAGNLFPVRNEQPFDGGGNSRVQLANGWTVAPTSKAEYIRQVPMPAVAGAAVTWTWTETNPLVLEDGTSILLWNYGAGATGIVTVYVKSTNPSNSQIVSPTRSNYSTGTP